MATAYPLDRQPQAFHRTMFIDGFDGILRAGGSEAASWWKEWRDAALIESYGQDQ